MFIIIDLFCGAGGTSTGFQQALLNGNSLAQVVACVNHDRFAIKSHRLNYKAVKHFREDIRKLDVNQIYRVMEYYKKLYPSAYVILWASLECTNFSWAKGGKPRDADSRTLANHLFQYIEVLEPHYIMIENVVEFMAWGPLNDKGRPISKKNGQYWLKWRQHIKDTYHYTDAWQELNSANFGAYTSRNRLFGIFAKPGLPIAFPTATHCKSGKLTDLFFGLQQWEPVKEVLNLSLHGASIFKRKKPLSEATLTRIYKGLQRFVAGYGRGKINRFISLYYTNGTNYTVEEPLPTITTKDRAALISLQWTEDTGFIYNPAWGGNIRSLDDPCCVIVARQDKAPLYLVQTCRGKLKSRGSAASEMTIKIQQFMADHGIADISLRMLTIPELLRIQGFPEDYKLTGTASDQKKFIGNAVVPIVVKAWTEALGERLLQEPYGFAA